MDENERVLRRQKNEAKSRVDKEESVAELNAKIKELSKELRKLKQINKRQNAHIQQLVFLTTKNEEEREARSILKNILESTIEYSIVALDLKGTILFWNKGAEHNYGYKAEEVVKKHTVKLIHLPEDISSGKVQEFFDTAFHEGQAEAIFRRIRKDKSHFLASAHVSLRKNEMGVPVGYVLISKDITESKAIESQLIKSNQELEQFAYIASHDLKAPLRAIERLATWIEEDNIDKLDQQTKDNLALLRQRTHRMSNLIDGILQYSRAGRTDLDLHKVNVKELLREVIDSINPGKRFRIIYQEDLPSFTAAKVPLSQVFANLINNSIKHHHKKKGKIKIGFNDLGHFYEFYVADDGPGIEPQYFDKIFMIFQTLKSRDEFEATGIGLSIVKKIVESQQGKVNVESTPGKGTTFYFTWPKYPRARKFKDSHKIA
ncbi:two-component sensor histidine kinase (plasmid) [Legionella adelaidensis]|uniref:histidine kinase n=1 Tax=Legionella adelaidensis TaxID=45056 RepID=A0A0W0R584_9GAMM|nr:ATP-binding protein [Legionella adelaidensis]KTC66240.1 two-component sensor histidine kinase [Legionella adelaidensis]VEH85755.1 two-component sensor histidine kinase [Legionella adelaidensis]